MQKSPDTTVSKVRYPSWNSSGAGKQIAPPFWQSSEKRNQKPGKTANDNYLEEGIWNSFF